MSITLDKIASSTARLALPREVEVSPHIEAKEIKGRRGRVPLRDVAEELEAKGFLTPSGKRYSASAVSPMLA